MQQIWHAIKCYSCSLHYFIAAICALSTTLVRGDEWLGGVQQPASLQNRTSPALYYCQSGSDGDSQSGGQNLAAANVIINDGSRVRITSSYGYISDGPQNYSQDMKCTWLIEAPNGGEIHLALIQFSTECNWDHLYIWDGNSVQAPLIGAFSGDLQESFRRHDIVSDSSGGSTDNNNDPSSMPPVLRLVARSGYAFIHFYSDAAYNSYGFNISFRICDKKSGEQCGGLLSSKTSPGKKNDDLDVVSGGIDADIRSSSSSSKAESLPSINTISSLPQAASPVSSGGAAAVFGCSRYFPCLAGGACNFSTGECACPSVNSSEFNAVHRRYPSGVDCSNRGYWDAVYTSPPTTGWMEVPTREGRMSPFSLPNSFQSLAERRSSSSSSTSSAILLSSRSQASGAAVGSGSTIPPPSASLALAQRDNEVFLIPGETFGSKPQKPLSRIYKFSIDTGRWQALDSQTRNNPDARYGHSAVWYERQNGIYIYGGVVNGTKVVSELWLWASDLDMFVQAETRSCVSPPPLSPLMPPSSQSTTNNNADDKTAATDNGVGGALDMVKKEPLGTTLRSSSSNSNSNFVQKAAQGDDDEVSVSKLPSSRVSSTTTSTTPANNILPASSNSSTSSSSSISDAALRDALVALRRTALGASNEAFTAQLFTQLIAASRSTGSKLGAAAAAAGTGGVPVAGLGYMSDCAQPIPATGHTAHIVDDKMIVIFGYGGSVHGLIPYVQEFDLATRTWRIIRPLGAIVRGTFGHASVYDHSNSKLVYISGGALQISLRVASVSQRLLAYDATTHVMTILKASPAPRVLHAGVASDDGLLLFFGGNPSTFGGNTCFSDSIWAYDTSCNAWTSVNSTTPFFTGVGTIARYGHASIWYNRQAYIFGGYRGLLLNDVIRFNPPSCDGFGLAGNNNNNNNNITAQQQCRESVKFGVKCFWDVHTQACASVSSVTHRAMPSSSSSVHVGWKTKLSSSSRSSLSSTSDENATNIDNELEHWGPHIFEPAAAQLSSTCAFGNNSATANSLAAGGVTTHDSSSSSLSSLKFDVLDAKLECERMENCHNCLSNKFGCHWCPMAGACTTLPCRMYTAADATTSNVAAGGGAVIGAGKASSSSSSGGDAAALVVLPLLNNISTVGAATKTDAAGGGADTTGQQQSSSSTITASSEIVSIEQCPSGVADRCRLQSVCASCNSDLNEPLCVWSAGKTSMCTPRSPAVDAFHLLAKLNDKQFSAVGNTKSAANVGGIQRVIGTGGATSGGGGGLASSKQLYGTNSGAVAPVLQSSNSSIASAKTTNSSSVAVSAAKESATTSGSAARTTTSTLDAALLAHFEQAAEQLLLSTASVSLECDTPCDARSSCAECVQHTSSCMWCASEQRCLDSSMYLMTYPYGQCKEWSTMLKKCDTMLKCEQLRACDTCLANPECGWCDDGSFTGLGTCHTGSMLAPHNVSQCPSSRWHFVTCPKCNCNGHSVCVEGNVCGKCANHTAGPQCDKCESGYFGDPRNGGDCKKCDCPPELSSGCDSTSGACNCIVKGLKGHRCDRCDDHYVGDPQSNDTSLDATCFYRLANGFQFTFNMSKPEDASYHQLNMANFPNDLDLDLRFAIACSNYSIVNVTVRSLASEQDATLIENLECSNFTENERIFTSSSNYPIGDKNTTFLVWIHMYKMPLVVKVSFVQVPALDLIQFFLVFSVCFIILLVLVGAGYKIKQRYDFYRRRQRMVVELEALAKRPYPTACLELLAPHVLQKHHHYHHNNNKALLEGGGGAAVESQSVVVTPQLPVTTASTSGGLLRYSRFTRASKQQPQQQAAPGTALSSTAPHAAASFWHPKYLDDALNVIITKEAALHQAKNNNNNKPNFNQNVSSNITSASGIPADMMMAQPAVTPLKTSFVVPLALEPLTGDKYAILSTIILLPHDTCTGYTPRDAAPFAIGTTMCTLSSGATRKMLFSSHAPKSANNNNNNGLSSGVRFFKRRRRAVPPAATAPAGAAAARLPVGSLASPGVRNIVAASSSSSRTPTFSDRVGVGTTTTTRRQSEISPSNRPQSSHSSRRHTVIVDTTSHQYQTAAASSAAALRRQQRQRRLSAELVTHVRRASNVGESRSSPRAATIPRGTTTVLMRVQEGSSRDDAHAPVTSI